MIDLDRGDDLDRVVGYCGGIPQYVTSPDEYMTRTSQAGDAL